MMHCSISAQWGQSSTVAVMLIYAVIAVLNVGGFFSAKMFMWIKRVNYACLSCSRLKYSHCLDISDNETDTDTRNQVIIVSLIAANHGQCSWTVIIAKEDYRRRLLKLRAEL